MTVRQAIMRASFAFALAALAAPAPGRRVIVLIGGNSPHNPNVHDAAAGIGRLAAALAGSPDLRGRVEIRSYPNGWPADAAAMRGAATIVCYFDGLARHPLLDPARLAAMAALMARGTGLVMLHQASTLPPDDRAVPLADWLGGARYGMVDRTVERAAFAPGGHPIASGIRPFAYRDEFYPTISFRAGVVPILQTPLHREAAPDAPAAMHTSAWAYVRPGGGRAFGFTGLHYLDTLDQPEVRRMILNAIVWTARLKVPAGGVRSEIAAPDAGRRKSR